MALPLLMNEGQHLDHFGNLIWSVYVDFRNPADRRPISTLVKGCEAQHAIEKTGRILISKPGKFRDFGEGLIRDQDEARPKRSRILNESVDDPGDLERAKQRDAARNRASQIVGSGSRTRTTSVSKTHSEVESFQVGKDTWIYCASIEPSASHEWNQWWQTLDDKYDHVSYIYRPRMFAREIACMAAEHLESLNPLASLSSSFEGLPTLETERPTQWVYHGPVIYVDDVYSLVEAANSKWEFLLLPFFAKKREYEAQREYRFVISAKPGTDELTKILPISPGMAGTIGKGKRGVPPQWMLDFTASKWDTASTKSDTKEHVIPGSESHGDVDGRLGHSLLNTNSLETEVFRDISQGSNPESVQKPSKINPDELPDEFWARTSVYSSVGALHSKVRAFLESDEESSEQKLRVTSAAWYAEQDIRALCEVFDEPVSGVSITSDGFIEIHLSITQLPNPEGKIAVAPTGESALRIVTPRRHLELTRDNRLPHLSVAHQLREFVEKLAIDA